MEANASFLRAARAGALDNLLECLDQNGADINACNPVGLIVCEILDAVGISNSSAKQCHTRSGMCGLKY